MAAETYYLRQVEIFNCIHNYFSQRPEFSYSIKPVRDNKHYTLIFADSEDCVRAEKKVGLIQIFFTASKTSLTIQGIPTYNTLAADCKMTIIDQCSILDIKNHNKSIVYHDVDTSKFNELIEYLSTEKHIILTPNGSGGSVVVRYTVIGPYDSYIGITYFQNGTVQIQGCISSLLIEVNTIALELFSETKSSNAEAFMRVLEASADKVISDNLDDHFSDRSHFVGTPFEAMILTSLHLMNSSIEVGDYGCIPFGILKALEGIIGIRLHEALAFRTKETIGARFVERPSGSGAFVINSSTSTNIADGTPLSRALSDGYTFYRAYRHTTFHCDIINPMASLILTTKETALGIVEDAIKKINNILRNW